MSDVRWKAGVFEGPKGLKARLKQVKTTPRLQTQHNPNQTQFKSKPKPTPKPKTESQRKPNPNPKPPQPPPDAAFRVKKFQRLKLRTSQVWEGHRLTTNCMFLFLIAFVLLFYLCFISLKKCFCIAWFLFCFGLKNVFLFKVSFIFGIYLF